eukprot:34215-Eustigmatos_ZCMA.PRE.1
MEKIGCTSGGVMAGCYKDENRTCLPMMRGLTSSYCARRAGVPNLGFRGDVHLPPHRRGHERDL